MTYNQITFRHPKNGTNVGSKFQIVAQVVELPPGKNITCTLSLRDFNNPNGANLSESVLFATK